MKYKIAVVGATGNVGREMLSTLATRKFPVSEVVAIASKKSVGKKVSFGEIDLTVQALETYDFHGTDIAFFAAGSAISKQYALKAADASCIVIDNSSFFRMEDDVPLVVPEVNPKALDGYKNRYIISNPNCSTIQLLVALKPLHDYAKIKRIIVSTYQSVSGAGKAAMDELFKQTKSRYINEVMSPSHFPKQIAFNIIPQVDDFMDDSYTREEWKMRMETKKILDPQIELSATCVRVPVFVGHSESVNVEFENHISITQAREILLSAPGVMLVDSPDNYGYVTPIDCVGDPDVYISRLRQDFSTKNALNMWIVSDNLRKGAALNAVQIAEELIHNYI